MKIKKFPPDCSDGNSTVPWYHPDLARRPSRPDIVGNTSDFRMGCILAPQLRVGYVYSKNSAGFHRCRLSVGTA